MPLRAVPPVFATLALAATLAGCVSNGTPSPSDAYARAGDTSVTFESVDGPPPTVFGRLVAALDLEAKARGIPIAARDQAASFRVRTYLAAQIVGGRPTLAWTWDVYDRNQQRALRLSGEEPLRAAGSDVWAAADETTLKRIAEKGLNGISPLVDGRAPVEQRAPQPPQVSTGSGVAEANLRRAGEPTALAFDAH